MDTPKVRDFYDAIDFLATVYGYSGSPWDLKFKHDILSDDYEQER